MGSNFSKEGITKDLEAMKASGIGGATIFNIASAVQESHKPTLNNPWPDQTYRSPKYWEALRHAAAEAQRLGLEIGLHNTVGYSTTGGPWIDEEKNMQNLVSKTVTVEGGKRVSIEIPRPDPTTYRSWGNSGRSFTFFKDIAILAVPASGDIDPSKVIDLTASFKDGRLDWDAPAGKWQVFRLAHAPTGANPHPLPDELIGKTLEVDKLSRDLNVFHWDQVIEPMKKHLGPYLGKSFKHFLIDSYEAGTQNWTPAFREEFKQRKGYDPLPWLLTLQNRIVGDKDLSARFKWDHDDFIRTLYYENGWRTGHREDQGRRHGPPVRTLRRPVRHRGGHRSGRHPDGRILDRQGRRHQRDHRRRRQSRRPHGCRCGGVHRSANPQQVVGNTLHSSSDPPTAPSPAVLTV